MLKKENRQENTHNNVMQNRKDKPVKKCKAHKSRCLRDWLQMVFTRKRGCAAGYMKPIKEIMHKNPLSIMNVN